MLRYQRKLEFATTLETEILACLLEGSKTVGELVELVFRVRKENCSFHQYYMRVSRVLRKMELEGYVSRRLFGSNKPYTLTHFALARLASEGDGPAPKLVDRWDLGTYGATIAAAVATVCTSSGVVPISRSEFMVVYTVLVFLCGVCSLRLAGMLKRVW